MKKLIVIVITLAASISAFAQDEDKRVAFSEDNAKLTVASAGDGLFNLNLLSHLGYGFHFVKSPDFTPRSVGNGEFFFNILEFELRPANFLGINLGVDMEFNHFHSDSHAFKQNADRYIKAIPFSEISTNPSRQRSGIFNFGLNFPLLVKGYFSGFEIGVGAEASLFLTGNNSYNWRNDYIATTITEKNPKFNTFSYGIIATVGYSGVGLFFKYYPSAVNILPAESLSLSYWTLGISVGL